MYLEEFKVLNQTFDNMATTIESYLDLLNHKKTIAKLYYSQAFDKLSLLQNEFTGIENIQNHAEYRIWKL